VLEPADEQKGSERQTLRFVTGRIAELRRAELPILAFRRLAHGILA